jgi:iron(III) transport system permease protein
MSRWRVGLAILLLLTVVLPVSLPFLELLRRPEAWRVWLESGRFASLALNTGALLAGTLALALPAGIAAAVLLYRSDLPFRDWLRFLTLLSLFVPLPLFATAWQAALGTTGWLPTAVWTDAAPAAPGPSSQGTLLKPWAYGLGPAIWVHSLAGLPWIILLVGQALVWVERELEEDLLMVVGPWRVLWAVTLPRCRVAIAAAGLWIALQAATEITITDMMQVRTFAEEVYGQIVEGDENALARAVTTSVPATIVACVLVLWVARRWEQRLPALGTLSSPLCLMWLGKARWPVFIALLALVGILAGIPVMSLAWKAGLAGRPSTWSAGVALYHVKTIIKADRGWMVMISVGLALLTGVLTAAIGLVTCWLARESRWFHALALGVMAITMAIAGPILGLGLVSLIGKITYPHWLAVAVYYGPSPLPSLWAQSIRFLPFAIAILWPIVRLLPAELIDSARVDGAGPAREFRYVVAPLTARSYGWAAFAVAVLALGEISAGKIVATPGWQTFAHEVFSRMHYGVSNDLAAMCLVLLGLVAFGGSVTLVGLRWRMLK